MAALGPSVVESGVFVGAQTAKYNEEKHVYNSRTRSEEGSSENICTVQVRSMLAM